jgi:hypothetical protein
MFMVPTDLIRIHLPSEQYLFFRDQLVEWICPYLLFTLNYGENHALFYSNNVMSIVVLSSSNS